LRTQCFSEAYNRKNLNKRITGKSEVKELDAETGLYYYGARYLDPRTSRWLSGDPAIYEGDYLPSAPINDEARKRNQNLPGMGGIFNHVNMHVYHYGGNKPVKFIDPDGRHVRIRITAEVAGTGLLRDGVVDSYGTRTVPTFRMIVTDDVTGTTSTYEVTRHAVYDGRRYGRFFYFQPRGESKTFRGMLAETETGTGKALYLYEDNDGGIRGDLFRSDTGGRNNMFLQIHVGGVYFNTELQRDILATSSGCFSLNGADTGDAGRNRFVNDIEYRLNRQPPEPKARIFVTIDRLE